MNREEIIRMAREAGVTLDALGGFHRAYSGSLERLANAAYEAGAAAQREADAVVCDWLPINDPHGQWHNDDMIHASLICAAAIRARGDK